jgi:hypothetical protein
MVRYSNARDWHKIQSEYCPRFRIQWPTVVVTTISFENLLNNVKLQSPSVNRTVRYSNGLFSDTICVKFSHGTIGHLVFNHSKNRTGFQTTVHRLTDHLKTGQVFPVFRCHLNTRPFDFRTQINHLNTRLVGIQVVTVNQFYKHYTWWVQFLSSIVSQF